MNRRCQRGEVAGPVRRKTSKIKAVDQPISMMPLSAVMGPSSRHCSTGIRSP